MVSFFYVVHLWYKRITPASSGNEVDPNIDTSTLLPQVAQAFSGMCQVTAGTTFLSTVGTTFQVPQIGPKIEGRR